ncbi:MAG TPA: hypothetical protein VGU71_14775 [Candidatus Dormibacteraeota bacterium]|nr:hypothetical protein [Candidatus Dormibacteraeota bacterium]
MSSLRHTLAVLRDPFNLALGTVVFLGALLLFAWSGQIVSRLPVGGLYLDLDAGRLAAVVAISAGFGLVVPIELEVYRQSRRKSIARTGTGLLSSSVTGVAALSCCSPLLLPAALGLLGVSGTSALYFNLALRRWFLPLALISLIVLAASGALALRDLTRACKVPAPPDIG